MEVDRIRVRGDDGKLRPLKGEAGEQLSRQLREQVARANALAAPLTEIFQLSPALRMLERMRTPNPLASFAEQMLPAGPVRYLGPNLRERKPVEQWAIHPPVLRVEAAERRGPADTGDRPPLDRWRADAVLEGDRKIWGLEAIAAFLGVSSDTVRRWKNDPAVAIPISRPAGTYFAFRGELLAWLRTGS